MIATCISYAEEGLGTRNRHHGLPSARFFTSLCLLCVENPQEEYTLVRIFYMEEPLIGHQNFSPGSRSIPTDNSPAWSGWVSGLDLIRHLPFERASWMYDPPTRSYHPPRVQGAGHPILRDHIHGGQPGFDNPHESWTPGSRVGYPITGRNERVRYLAFVVHRISSSTFGSHVMHFLFSSRRF